MTPIADSSAKIKRCAVCKIDFKGRFVYVDDGVAQLLGHSKEELFGKSFLDFIEADEQPTVARILYQRNHFETFFESLRLSLIDRASHQIRATIVVSLNFIAGNPVNFQIIIDVEEPSKLDTSVHREDISFQQLASELIATGPTNYTSEAVHLLHRYAGIRRNLIYELAADRIDLFCSSDERLDEIKDVRSYEPLLQWVAAGGEEYFFLDPDHVRHAIEKTASAPNEFITRFELPGARLYLMRVAFDEADDPTSIQSAVTSIRHAIRLICRLAPDESDLRSGTSAELTVNAMLAHLNQSGVYCCLTGADGSIQLLDPKFKEHVNITSAVERHRDLFVALAVNNRPEVMQSIVDTVCIPRETDTELRFDEVINIANGLRARLMVVRLNHAPQDESACFILIPLSRGDAEKYDGSIDNGSLRAILLELQSTVLAASSVTERLAHEFYDELGRDGNYYLSGLGDKTRKLNGMLTALLSSLQVVDDQEPIQTVDLNLLISTVEAELRSNFSGTVFTITRAELPKILTRPNKLGLALKNILVNSLKYGKAGGVEISVQAVTVNETCSLSISDNGPGISHRFLPRVQEFYYRAPDPRTQAIDGLGCGLAIVRQIMKSLGGRMSVVSDIDKGTTVTLVFPVTSAEKSKS